MKGADIVTISRRTTLKWFAAAAASGIRYDAVWAQGGASLHGVPARPVSTGYGTDPDLLNPKVPWSRTLSRSHLQMVAILADLILPCAGQAPAPSALGIQEFVDEWVSAPYPQQQSDRVVILAGLNWIDAEASRRWQRSFLQLDDSEQESLMFSMVPQNMRAITSAQEKFFARFRFLVVGAYYTTPQGFEDIGYIGNVALLSYPPVTEYERAILDEELRKLGIE